LHHRSALLGRYGLFGLVAGGRRMSLNQNNGGETVDDKLPIQFKIYFWILGLCFAAYTFITLFVLGNCPCLTI
jgi:hypothetical protein